jgi:hypothetical protein
MRIRRREEGRKQKSQRRRENQTIGGLRDRIREKIRLRWVSPVHLRCLTKA